MVKQFRFAAVALIAGATIVITTAAAFAFSQQTVTPNSNGNYDFNYGSLDGKAKLNDSKSASDPNSPGFHFSVESGQTDRFGFHGFGGNSNAGPPDYSRPLGNGD